MLNLIVTLLLPICGICVLAVIPSTKVALLKKISLFFTLLTFYFSLFLWIFFEKSTFLFQYLFYTKWFSFLNINFILGIDGISLFFILLTTFLTPICILSGWKNLSSNIKEFCILFLCLEVFLLFIFSVLDLLLFYVFFESVLIPMVRRKIWF